MLPLPVKRYTVLAPLVVTVGEPVVDAAACEALIITIPEAPTVRSRKGRTCVSNTSTATASVWCAGTYIRRSATKLPIKGGALQLQNLHLNHHHHKQ